MMTYVFFSLFFLLLVLSFVLLSSDRCEFIFLFLDIFLYSLIDGDKIVSSLLVINNLKGINYNDTKIFTDGVVDMSIKNVLVLVYEVLFCIYDD